MSTAVRYLCVLAAWLVVLARCPAADEALSRVEISKIGKSATALVEVKGARSYSYGSAFCVHPSGLFVTNEHVVRDQAASGTVTLVLDSALKTQRVLQAKVVRSDKESDLALLRVEGAKDLPALALGSDEKLAELEELVGFGFPFGTALSTDKKEYPAISVNVCSITSLRRKDGDLHRIQLDGALNPGHSGGPVLDKSGKVVGVVVSGVVGAGINFAIPVSQLARFVARPDVQFTAPALSVASLHKPVAFEVRAVPVLPSAKPPAVELILKPGDGKEQRHKMEHKDGVFRVTTVAVPPPDGPRVLRLTATFADGSLTGAVTDQAFKVGDKEIKLSDVSRLQFKPKPQAVLHDGKTVEGVIAGLDKVTVQLGEEALALNLSRAVAAGLEAPPTVTSVACTVVVTQDGKEVARLSDTISVQGVARVDGKPAVLEAEKVVRDLPAPATDVAVGGGGRFLVLHLPKLRKLAVFDVTEAKVVKYLPTSANNIKFTAGLDKLIVVQPSSYTIERWSLNTFEREAETKIAMKVPPVAVAMGSASDGPLVISGCDWPSLGETAIFDIQKMKRIEVSVGPHAGFHTSPHVFLRASADGRVFVCQAAASGGLQSFVWAKGDVQKYEGGVGDYPVPSPDGTIIYTTQGRYNSQLKEIAKDRIHCLPAHQGHYYLGVRPGDRSSSPRTQKASVSVHLAGDARLHINLAEIEGLDGWDPWNRDELSLDKRVHFIPDAKVIVTIPASNDRLVVHRFDVEQALEKSGIDYLFVTSQPPTSVKKAESLTYQLAVKSKKGGLKYKLESGPKDMTISDSGKLTWQVPADFAEKETSVIVSIRDAGGQECFHTFTLSVRE